MKSLDTQKQIKIQSHDNNTSGIIFMLSEDYLLINYLNFYIKLLKKNIKKVKIETNKLNKIFISIEGGTKLEYQFFDDNNNTKEIYDFFELFIVKK